MDPEALRQRVHTIYDSEREELGEDGLRVMLERAEEWQLAPILSAGGALVFPHAGIVECGHQQAACAQAALDCGADTVIVISVLHPFTAEMEAARGRVTVGGEPSEEAFWGIQGTGIDGSRQEWRGDHALVTWRYLWDAELRRRGLSANRAPRVIERYPYLAGGRPQELPGFAELAREAEGAAIVSTADSFHHGIGYGDAPAETHDMDAAGLTHARSVLEEGIDLLGTGDYVGYERHCLRAKSDARDAGPVFHALRPHLRGRILELVGSDACALYDAPPPTWVAAALVAWE